MKIAAYFLLLLAFCPAHASLLPFAPDNFEITSSHPNLSHDEIDGVPTITARLDVSKQWAFVRITPKVGAWDLSAYSRLEVRITNQGASPIRPIVRLDERDDGNRDTGNRDAWNTARIQILRPGETKTFTVVFGQDHNAPKSIDTSNIGALQIFAERQRTAPTLIAIHGIKAVK